MEIMRLKKNDEVSLDAKLLIKVMRNAAAHDNDNWKN